MPPTKLAHLVFQTNRLPAMRDWYCAVLDGRVIYENPQLCFVTYDDEHHRVAFIDFGPLANRDLEGGDLRYRATDQPGLHHVAFTFASMGELLGNYERLAARSIRPFRSINPAPTTSMYYVDPDGNRVELQIDNFATAEEGQAWMLSPAFDRNPIGVEFEPDDLVRRFRAGVPVAELVLRD
jgi:catechol-2,3-dioxygenase